MASGRKAPAELEDDLRLALAASASLANLQRLDLEGEEVGKAAQTALLARFGSRVAL